LCTFTPTKKAIMVEFDFSADFAKKMDSEDKLARFRSQFLFPQHNNKNVLYYTGNSLGLQPKRTQDYLQQELNDWGKYALKDILKPKTHGFRTMKF